MTFRVEQKVECLDASQSKLKNVGNPLRFGAIYIIRGFDQFERVGVRGVYLDGVHLRPRIGKLDRGNGDELAFHPARFRALE